MQLELSNSPIICCIAHNEALKFTNNNTPKCVKRLGISIKSASVYPQLFTSLLHIEKMQIWSFTNNITH